MSRASDISAYVHQRMKEYVAANGPSARPGDHFVGVLMSYSDFREVAASVLFERHELGYSLSPDGKLRLFDMPIYRGSDPDGRFTGFINVPPEGSSS